MKTEVKKHTDIRGKELLYLIITQESEQVIVNIGNKTYDAVAKMQKRHEKLIGSVEQEVPRETKEEKLSEKMSNIEVVPSYVLKQK